MKMTYVLAFYLCLLAYPLQADNSSKVDNHLGKAYQLVVEGDMEQAKKHFTRSAELSLTDNNDRGIMESIRGLYVLGDEKTAENYSARIVENSQSWRAVCGVGYLYASIKGMGGKANQAFYRSYKLASNRGDWIGMAETGKALSRIGKKDEALKMLASAEKSAELQKAYGKMNVISDIYRQMGEEGRAFTLEQKIRSMAIPIPQVIDTVPGDDKISEEAQRARSEQVSRDIEADNVYIVEKMRIQEEKYYRNWNRCLPFFTYLFFDMSDQYGYDYLVPDVVIAPGLMRKWGRRNIDHYDRSSSGAYFYKTR